MKKYLVKLIWAVLLLVLAIPMNRGAAQDIAIDVYTVNDFRGAMRAEADDPGAALLAGAIDQVRTANPTGTVVLGGGNMLFGSIESDTNNGFPVINIMNMMGFDANVMGSHFFDFKPAIFSQQVAAAKFPYLVCNVKAKEGETLAKPYVILERKGLKIGVVGVTTNDIQNEASPKNVAQFTFLDQVASTQQAINEVRAKGAVIVVLLAHCGVEQRIADGVVRGEAVDLMMRLHGVDACFTGDSQNLVNGTMAGKPMMQGGTHGRYLAKVHFIYSTDEKAVKKTSQELLQVKNMNALPNEYVANAVRPLCNAVDEKYGQVLTYNYKYLGNDKYEQSAVAEYLTDLLRHSFNADFAILNGGGFKADLPVGKVTARRVMEIYPHRDKVVVLQMKGKDVLDAIDFGVDNKLVGQGRFSGIRVAFEPDMPQGQRIVDLVLPDGGKVALEKVYTVVTNSFLANGGDGYVMFKKAISRQEVDPDIQAFFIRALGNVGSINYREDKRWSVGELRK
jgi:2',3'-cyclic-nucleotide 2'-phosphodiesterase/3'-nucleotidase